MRPASFQNGVAVDGTWYDRTRYALNPRMSYFAPEPKSVSPFSGYYAAEPPLGPPGVVYVHRDEAAPRCRERPARVVRVDDGCRERVAVPERVVYEAAPRARAVRDGAPRPERFYFDDGYGRESRRYPGVVRHRYAREPWERTGHTRLRPGDPRSQTWEWFGRSVTAGADAPGPPAFDDAGYGLGGYAMGGDAGAGAPEAKDEPAAPPEPAAAPSRREASLALELERERERSAALAERLVAAADARAARAEEAARSRVDALEARLEDQRRELEYLGGRTRESALLADDDNAEALEAAADDEVIEAFDRLREENAELRRRLAGAVEAPAPARSPH